MIRLRKQTSPAQDGLESFWSLPATEIMTRLRSSTAGLSQAEAALRLRGYGPNLISPRAKSGLLIEFLDQFKSPIIMLLLFAAGLAYFLAEPTEATIIVAIIFFSSLLSFWQQHSANDAMSRLAAMVSITTSVVRDGQAQARPVEEVVPGDVLLLSAGDIIPADAVLLEINDLFVDQALLTGESFPVHKSLSPSAAENPTAKRLNVIYMGTHVASGSARALVVRTGAATGLGQISAELKLAPPETEFEHGVRHFGYLLMEVTTVLILIVFGYQCFFPSPHPGFLSFFDGASRGVDPPTLTGHNQHQPGSGCHAYGA